MFPENWYMFFAAALIPMIVGSIWYGPLFGKSWMKTLNFTEEDLQGGNMPLIMGLSYLLSVVLAFGLSGMVVHQAQIPGLFIDFGPGSPEWAEMQTFVNKYGDVHRTWSHGAVHGFIAALFIALPIICIKALFERRSGKYIFINWGYWAVTLIIMGAVLCQTLKWGAV